jgi:hypothetical protein
MTPARRPVDRHTVTVALPLEIWLDVLAAFAQGADAADRVSEISKVLQAADRAAKIQRGVR